MNAGSTHISMVSFQARIACQRGSVATAGSTQAERLIAFVGCGHWAMDRKAFYPSVRSRDLVRIPEQKRNLQSRRMTLESGCAGHCDCYDIRMS
jgi:hypothetical protein